MLAEYLNNAVTDVTETPKARAGSDFMAGIIWGWVINDVKYEMDTCFPDDEDLADSIDAYL